MIELYGRSPLGERGLKYMAILKSQEIQQSLSARRAWIEIYSFIQDTWIGHSRSPLGERGLK